MSACSGCPAGHLSAVSHLVNSGTFQTAVGVRSPHKVFPCLFYSSDAIYSALYDGTEVIEILRGHEYLSHPFAVSVFGGSVYWTDWRTNTLAKANKWTGNNVTVIQKTSAQPFDLQIYHPSRQPQSEYFYSDFSCIVINSAMAICPC